MILLLEHLTCTPTYLRELRPTCQREITSTCSREPRSTYPKKPEEISEVYWRIKEEGLNVLKK